MVGSPINPKPSAGGRGGGVYAKTQKRPEVSTCSWVRSAKKSDETRGAKLTNTSPKLPDSRAQTRKTTGTNQSKSKTRETSKGSESERNRETANLSLVT